MNICSKACHLFCHAIYFRKSSIHIFLLCSLILPILLQGQYAHSYGTIANLKVHASSLRPNYDSVPPGPPDTARTVERKVDLSLQDTSTASRTVIAQQAEQVSQDSSQVNLAVITNSSSQLQVHPDYLHFAKIASGIIPNTQPLYISAKANGTVDFTVTENIPWLHINTDSGSASVGPVTIQVTVDATKLSPESSPYIGELVIRGVGDSNDVRRIRVRATVSNMYSTTSLYSYDGNNNLQRLVRPDGSIIDYEYDPLNRLISVRYPDASSVAYTYDANGNRTSMTDSWGTTRYEYDRFDRLVAVDYPTVEPIRYSYDEVGNVKQIVYPNQEAITYAYDNDGRLVKVSQGEDDTTYQYDSRTGLLTRVVLPNNVSTEYGYDPDARLIDVIHRKSNDSLLMSFHYELDANGLRTRMTKIAPSVEEITEYEYDALYRLVRVTYPDVRTVDYAYDGLGNRVAMTDSVSDVTHYTYDSDNRLLRAGDEVFLYDMNGNITRRASPTRTIYYTYDYENRLLRYEDGKHVVEFRYDGDGNRISKVVDGVPINYINDIRDHLAQVVSEADENWLSYKTYVYGKDRVGYWAKSDGRFFYLHDAPLRSTIATVDSDGMMVNRFKYDVFGTYELLEGSLNDFHLYDGELSDPETGLIYLRRRYYDPSLGRFLSREPFPGHQRRPQSMNPYAFAENNPVSFSDPSGKYTAAVFVGLSILAVIYFSLTGWGVVTDERVNPEVDLYLEAIGTAASGAVPGSEAVDVLLMMPDLQVIQLSQLVKLWECYIDNFGLPDEPPTFYPDNMSETLRQIVDLRDKYGGDPKNCWTRIEPKEPVSFNIIPIAYASELEGDLGGVSLNKTADLLFSVDDLTGATYDPATDQIIFFGEENASLPEMDPDELLVALSSVYANQDPAISIDPPVVDGQFSVRYEGATRGTEFGWILFESDRLIKILGLGKDNITGEAATSKVPGFKTMLERLVESGECDADPTTIRFWLQPSEVRLVRSDDGKTILFDKVAIEMLTELQYGGNGISHPDAEAFAAHFTEHYDEFAEEWPVLKDLKRLAKVVAVVRWMKDNNIPVDFSFFDDYQMESYPTPDWTPSISVVGDNGTCHIILEGGATLETENSYLPDEPNDSKTENMRDSAIQERPAEEEFSWNFLGPDGEQHIAIAESLSRGRKDGNVSFSETDFANPLPGSLSLKLTRYYDSFEDKSSGFGTGWSVSPFELRFASRKTAFIFSSNGPERDLFERIWVSDRLHDREDEYVLVGLDVTQSPFYLSAGTGDILRVLPDDSFLFIKENGISVELDTAGRVAQIADANRNSLSYSWNEQGQLVRITSSSGASINLKYDTKSRITTATGPGNQVFTYEYDVSNLLSSVVNSLGHSRTYKYDSAGRLTTIIDANGNEVFSVKYDIYNRAVQRNTGAFNDTSYVYSLAHRQTQVTTPYSDTTTHRFDEDYRLVEQVDPLGNRQSLVYEQDYGPKVITDSRGTTTEIVYDELGKPREIIDGMGAKQYVYFDAFGRIVASQDSRGNATYFAYNEVGNPAAVYSSAELRLDENGELIGATYDPTFVTQFRHDEAGNLIAVTDAHGHEYGYTFNSSGLPVNATSPNGVQSEFVYDERGRVSALDSHGAEVHFAYDAADNMTVLTTTAGSVNFGHDKAGNITSWRDTRGNVTTLTYDNAGSLISVMDAANGKTNYEYDLLQRLTSVDLPNGSSNLYTYDELGRVASTQIGLQNGSPILGLTNDRLDFIGVQRDAQISRNVILFNLGRVPLQIINVSITPPFVSDFAEPFTIEPGETHTLNVIFVATDTGVVGGELVIQSNDHLQPARAIPITAIASLEVMYVPMTLKAR